MLNFEGQVAIVTGAGRGIGRATALALAKRGAKVLVNDYGGKFDTMTPGSRDVAQSVVDEIIEAGGEAAADASSVGTGESAQAIVDAAVKAFGRVDILVNNAGGSRPWHNIDEDLDDAIEGVVRSNLLGSMMLMRRVWPLMRAQNYGRIVNISSNTVLGMQGVLAYVPQKAASSGLQPPPLSKAVRSVFMSMQSSPRPTRAAWPRRLQPVRWNGSSHTRPNWWQRVSLIFAAGTAKRPANWSASVAGVSAATPFTATRASWTLN